MASPTVQRIRAQEEDLSSLLVPITDVVRSSLPRNSLPPLCRSLIQDGEPMLAAKMAYLAGLKYFFGWHAPLDRLDSYGSTPKVRTDRAIFLENFAREHVVDNCRFLKDGPFRGAERIADKQIIDLIERKLSKHPSEIPLTILEVAAGSTHCSYGTLHVGAPWLSRALKMRFGERVNIIVTDLAPPSIYGHATRVCLSPNGKVEFQEATSETETHIWRSPLSHDQFKTAASWPSTSERKISGESVFLRPVLDPDFEGAVFGLEVQQGVDMRRLGDHFMFQEFDVIFARHLPPEYEGGLYDIDSMAAFLAPLGELIVHVDSKDRNPDIRLLRSN